MKKFRSLVIIIFAILTSVSVDCQSPDALLLNNTLPVLNGRAVFSFPENAANVKRSIDIMSADPNENEETRIVLDMDKMRVIFYAQELYTIADGDWKATVTKSSDAFSNKIISDKEELFAILSTPNQHDAGLDAILVNTMLVKTADNTFFRISAYINPAAFSQLEAFTRLSDQVFSSIMAGTRTIDRSARKETQNIFGTKKSFVFSLPENYTISVDQQYDFQVFKLHRFQTISDTSWMQVIIYNGFYPSPVYKDYGLSETNATMLKGKFMGNKITWMEFNLASAGIYDREQLIPADDIEKGLIFHIAILSNSKDQLEDLTKIVESVKLVDE